MFHKGMAILSSLILLAALVTPAIPQNGEVYSLDKCIKLALKNNSALKTAGYEVNRSGANVKGSYANILPTIGTSLNSSRTFRGERVDTRDIQVDDPVTGQISIVRRDITQPTQQFNFYQMQVSYNQRLFDFGRSWNLIKQAKSSFDASSQNLASARQNVFSNVKLRYFDLLKAMKLEQEFQLAVERSKEQLRRTQSMYEIGSVAQIDVYRQEVTLGSDEVNLINQSNVLEIAKGNLNIEMGRDPETHLTIADIDVNMSPPSFSLDEAISITHENSPELRRFEFDMKSADYGRKAAKGRYWPSFGLGITYTKNNQVFNRVYGDFNQNFQVRVGAQIDFNIFNGLSDAAEVSRQTANYSIANENWVKTRRQKELEVKQAYLNLKAFSEIAQINERNVRSAEEDFRLAQERYRVGAGTSLEVTDSQVNLTRARVQLVAAQYDAMIARAQLEAAMGTSDRQQE